MAKDIDVVLDKLFSHGIVNNLGTNKTPDFFAETMVNLRLRNGGITARQWQKQIFDWESPIEIQAITSNKWELHYVHDWHFFTYDLENAPVDRWDIDHKWDTYLFTYGDATIILTWADRPRVWDWSSLDQTTNSNIPAWVNPSFWGSFAWFTYVNDTWQPNILRISRPISLANQDYAYDWTWSWAEQITFSSKIVWAISTLNFLWIFTEKSIEYISRDNLTTTWWVASLYAIPIAWGDVLLNPSTITSANEFIFYVTRDLQIKTVNYVQGNPVPEVAVISENIRELLQTQLHEDQPMSFSFYDKKENIVTFVFRSIASTVNDMHIIYDLNTNQWLMDMDKNYIWVAVLNEKIYAGSAFSYSIIQDNVGTDDFSNPVNWEFVSSNMILWNPLQVKQFRGTSLAGKYNINTLFEWQVLVDWTPTMTKTIDGGVIGNVVTEGIWWESIGGEPIWWDISNIVDRLVDFWKDATIGALRLSGKKMSIRLAWWSRGQKFIIDYASIKVRPRKRTRSSDRV
jgi:hypothetical protein